MSQNLETQQDLTEYPTVTIFLNLHGTELLYSRLPKEIGITNTMVTFSGKLGALYKDKIQNPDSLGVDDYINANIIFENLREENRRIDLFTSEYNTDSVIERNRQIADIIKVSFPNKTGEVRLSGNERSNSLTPAINWAKDVHNSRATDHLRIYNHDKIYSVEDDSMSSSMGIFIVGVTHTENPILKSLVNRNLSSDVEYINKQIDNSKNHFIYEGFPNRDEALANYYVIQSKNLINVENLFNVFENVKTNPTGEYRNEPLPDISTVFEDLSLENEDIAKFINLNDINKYQPELRYRYSNFTDKEFMQFFKKLAVLDYLNPQLTSVLRTKKGRFLIGLSKDEFVFSEPDCNLRKNPYTNKLNIGNLEHLFKYKINNNFKYTNIHLSDILIFFQNLGFMHINIIEQSCSSFPDDSTGRAIYASPHESEINISEGPRSAPQMRKDFSTYEKQGYREFTERNSTLGGKKTKKHVSYKKNKSKRRRKTIKRKYLR
jgi:hypothetical protein